MEMISVVMEVQRRRRFSIRDKLIAVHPSKARLHLLQFKSAQTKTTPEPALGKLLFSRWDHLIGQ
jgi:hypothetical protein